jgi:predicted PurR-regulated permease PerM
MPQGKWFRIGNGIIVVLLIAYLASKVNYLFDPIGAVITALFVPIVISGMFYYVFRPPVRLLAKSLPLGLSIIIVYLAVFALIFLFSWIIWPPVREQSLTLVQNFPDILDSVRKWLETMQRHPWIKSISKDNSFSAGNLSSQLSTMLGDLLNSVVGSISSVFNVAMSFFLLLGLVRFIIYYMLKEGHKFPAIVLRMLPERYHNVALPALKDIDSSIEAFILSKVITSLIIGTLTFGGYLIVGLPYPLLLGLVAAITNVIPYLGPLIAAVPTVIVALTISPITVLQVCVIIFISNQIEANLISPKIMGKQMNVHPLTIMLLVIGAGAVIGPIGMVIVVPTYAILKIIAIRVYNFHQNNKIDKKPNLLPPPPRM